MSWTTVTADCRRNFSEAKKASCRGPSCCSPGNLCDAQLEVTRVTRWLDKFRAGTGICPRNLEKKPSPKMSKTNDNGK